MEILDTELESRLNVLFVLVEIDFRKDQILLVFFNFIKILHETLPNWVTLIFYHVKLYNLIQNQLYVSLIAIYLVIPRAIHVLVILDYLKHYWFEVFIKKEKLIDQFSIFDFDYGVEKFIKFEMENVIHWILRVVVE